VNQTSAPPRLPVSIIVCGSLICLISVGVRAGFGLFLPAVSGDLGWGREVFALGIAIQNLVWGLGLPFFGIAADKWGSGRTIALGGLCYAAGVALMSATTTPLSFHLSAGLMVGLGLSGTGFGVVLAAMGKAAGPERRSLALGFGAAAGSLGQFTLVPVGQMLLAAYGWQTAFLLLAAISTLMLPLIWPLRSPPAARPVVGVQSLGAALAEARRHRGYCLLTCGYFVCGFHVAFISVHLPAYVVDKGLSPEIGAWALALVGLMNVAGSLLSGYVGGRWSKKNSLCVIYASRAVVFTVFVLTPTSVASVLGFAVVMGFLWLSTVPLTTAVVAQIFGPRYMATLVGIVFLSHQLGSFSGVWLGGYLYDATGSYDAVWWLGVVLAVTAALLHWPIDERALRPAEA
jgi:predicted MFS family arabinose efflux permease